MSANVQHSMATAEHGTPPEYVELARYALGSIDLDPASSSYWNHHLVNATRFFDERMNGLSLPWYGRVFCNPPGGNDANGKSLVRQFWERLVEHWIDGRVHSAVWLGYSLEQLVVLQSSPFHPAQLVCAIPPGRIGFMVRNGSAPPERSKAPTHGNYITLLQTRQSPAQAREQMTRFFERASSNLPGMGCAVVRPWS